MVVFGVAALYPFAERRLSRDRARHHLLDRSCSRAVCHQLRRSGGPPAVARRRPDGDFEDLGRAGPGSP